jgi:hypothetical protein
MDRKAAYPDRAITCWYCFRSVPLPREFWADPGLDEPEDEAEDEGESENPAPTQEKQDDSETEVWAELLEDDESSKKRRAEDSAVGSSAPKGRKRLKKLETEVRALPFVAL